MKSTLEALNRMQADGIVGSYAIGGAVAATFYLEPAATVDLDVFIDLPKSSPTALVSLASIYAYLKNLGYAARAEYVDIAGWPVQFLVPREALEDEALRQAVSVEVEGTTTRVMTPEHLVAIALRTGRVKDHARIVQFLAEDAVDRGKLQQILEAHGLEPTWQRFERRYLHE